MKNVLVLFLFLTALASDAGADPDESAKFLMNEPVSLLDLGVYKLEKDLKGFRKDLSVHHALPFDIAVNYDWGVNKIVIQLTYGYEGNPPPKTIRNGVRNVFKKIRSFLGVDPEGKVYHKRGFSKAADYFSHQGYVMKNRPPALEKNIDRMTEFKAIFSVQNFSRIFECRQMLTGSRVGDAACQEQK